MKIKIIVFLMLIIPFCSFAQQCPQSVLNPQIDVVINNIQIDQQKTASQLKAISTNPLHEPIGLYRGNRMIHIEPFYQIRGYSFGICSKISELKLKIELSPVVYISKEAQQFKCTYDRVYEHEMTHFKIEVNALNKLKISIGDYISKKYSNPISTYNEKEIKNYINEMNKASMSYIYNFLEVETLPFHQAIDTTENYRHEGKKCSYQENVSLSQLLAK